MTMGFSEYLIALLVALLAHVALAVGFGFDEGEALKRGFDDGGPIVIGSLSDWVSSELGPEDLAEIEEAPQVEEVEAIEEMEPVEEIIEPENVEEVPSDIIEQVSDTIPELESKPIKKKKRTTRNVFNAKKKAQSRGGRGEGGRALRSNYKGRIIAHLRRHRQYPKEAKRRGIKGTARMRFTLNALGRILSSRLIASSGSTILDKGARSTVKRANPFPPFPKGLNKSRWTFTVPIRFNVR